MAIPTEVAANVSAQAATYSSYAAIGAALIALGAMGVNLWIGHRQSKAALMIAEATLESAKRTGRYKVAEFRQAWINNVREVLAEYQSIVIARREGIHAGSDEFAKVVGLRMRLALYLNPKEPDSLALLQLCDDTLSEQDDEVRFSKGEEMRKLAHKILKAEWKRIKGEFDHSPTIGNPDLGV